MSLRPVPLLILFVALVGAGAWLAIASGEGAEPVAAGPLTPIASESFAADALVASGPRRSPSEIGAGTGEQQALQRAPVAPLPDDLGGPKLRVVEAATKRGIAGAEVFVGDAPADRRVGRNAEELVRWADALERRGSARRTDAQGDVQLPSGRRRLSVMARAPGLFGVGVLREGDPQPTLELAPDRTLRVRVRDAADAPLIGVAVALCVDLGAHVQRMGGARTDGEGIAVLPHVQLYETRLSPNAAPAEVDGARQRGRIRNVVGQRQVQVRLGPDGARGGRDEFEPTVRRQQRAVLEAFLASQNGEAARAQAQREWQWRAAGVSGLGATTSPNVARREQEAQSWPLADFVVLAEVPQVQPVEVRLAPIAVPTDLVELRLAATTSLTLGVLGPDSQPLTTPYSVVIRAINPAAAADPKQQSIEQVCVLRADKRAGVGTIQVGPIGLGLRLHVAVRFADDDFDFEQGDLAGPTSLGPFTLSLRVPNWMSMVVGRLVDAAGTAIPGLDADLFVAGGNGRVEGERVALAADGRFELPVRLRQPAPPYTLEVLARAGERRFGCLVALPELGVGRHHDVGDVTWKELPVLVSGLVRDDRGQPIENADVEVQALRGAAWTQESFEQGRTDASGAFTLYGEPRALSLRVRARARDHAPAERQFTCGERVELILLRQGSLRAEGFLPAFVAREALRATLTDLATGQARDLEVRKPAPDRFLLHATGLRPGAWQLALQVRGLTRPLAIADRVEVPPADTARPDRIDGLDLRGRLFQFQIRAVDQAGKAMGDPGSPLFVQLHDAAGAPSFVPFAWSGGQIELVTDEPSLTVVGLAAGSRPARTLLQAGESTVQFTRIHPLPLHLPGLRAMLGPEQAARISLVYAGDTGLPTVDLQATWQRSGRTRGYARANLGKSGGASLGSGDEVTVALMFNGPYEIVLRLDGPGGRVSKTIGMVQGVLDGPTPLRVTELPQVDAVRDALAELRARPARR